MSEPAGEPSDAGPPAVPERSPWPRAISLFLLTFLSMLYAGADREVDSLAALVTGWDFAVPLMAILLCHELGHYFAGRLRGVDISPPYFIPMPFMLFGTLGAVIRMPDRIRNRNALFDVGAAGPYAGLAVAIPVLIYGIASSPVTPLPDDGADYFIEGRSLLYAGLLYALKGPIPEGQDIFLSSTALAGWAGLMVTMMNLVPVGQLDGGHVSYALLGDRAHRLGRVVLFSLPVIGALTGTYYALDAVRHGYDQDTVITQAMAGLHWIVWFAVLQLIARLSGGHEHPPTDDGTLSPARQLLASATLLLFVLLFMPSWMREPPELTAGAAEAPAEAS
jgi:membrane-associated protease RseP (regulator of RpoE activity)